MLDFPNHLLCIIEKSEGTILKRLQSCNNEIEKDFTRLKNIGVPSQEVLSSISDTLEDTAKALHSKLLVDINDGWNCGIIAISNKEMEGQEFASETTMEVAKSMVSQHALTKPTMMNDKYKNKLMLLSELLRGCKNIIRWFRILRLNHWFKKVIPEALDRLCSTGMICLCVAFLKLYSFGKENEHTATLVRNASTTLFHATFGPASKQSKTIRKGLAYLVQPSGDFNWISMLAKLLMLPHSVPVMLSFVRNLHNLVGSVPGITSKLNNEFEALLLVDQNIATGEKDGKPPIKGSTLSVLVSLLAWTLQSDPTFPGSDPSDLRSQLAIEILRVLFAIRSNDSNITKKLEESNPEVMTQLGILIVDILHLSNRDRRAYETKLSALGLLMDPPPAYCQFLVINKVIDPLLTILWLQLNDVLVVNGGAKINDEKNAALMLPILVVLNKLSQFNPTIKKQCKEYVFPPKADVDITPMSERKGQMPGGVANLPGKNVKPINAPPGTVRWKLIQLMTFIDSNVKRCASELLWNLCDGDPKEFVTRTGFGNAVHLLGIKGIVQIPS